MINEPGDTSQKSEVREVASDRKFQPDSFEFRLKHLVLGLWLLVFGFSLLPRRRALPSDLKCRTKAPTALNVKAWGSAPGYRRQPNNQSSSEGAKYPSAAFQALINYAPSALGSFFLTVPGAPLRSAPGSYISRLWRSRTEVRSQKCSCLQKFSSFKFRVPSSKFQVSIPI